MAVPLLKKKIIKKRVKQFKRHQSDRRITVKLLLRTGSGEGPNHKGVLYAPLPCIIARGCFQGSGHMATTLPIYYLAECVLVQFECDTVLKFNIVREAFEVLCCAHHGHLSKRI